MSPICILSVLVFFSSFLDTPACSAATDTISAGQALVGDDKLVSNNSKFVLGFFQSPSKSSGSGNTTPRWYLGIWFSKVPNLTTVWIANRASPITDIARSALLISDDGNLVILNRATRSMMWSTEVTNMTTKNNTVAVLLNSGNLVLEDVSNSSHVLWQSFDHPTDTWLPSAKIGRNKITGLNRRLVSKKSLTDPAPGAYCYEIDPIVPQLILKLCNSSITYWSSGAWNGKYFTGIPEMSGNVPGFEVKFVNNSEEEYIRFNVADETVLTRNIIEVSGQNRYQVWFEGSQDWLTLFATPKAQCDVYAVCGPFTVCNYNMLPLCDCMEGFSVRSPRDWEQDDRTGGCMRHTPLDCNSNRSAAASTDKFYSMPGIILPDHAHGMQNVGSSDECAKACLNNCSCTAYSYGSSGCFVWNVELLNAKQQKQQSDITTSNGGILYLRLAAKDVQSGRSNRRKIIIGIITGASIAALGFLVFVLVVISWRNKTKRSSHTLNSIQSGCGIVAFRYKDLRYATKNFSEKLGVGGFGSVFKGLLHDSTSIAVKRLDSILQGEKQFRAEVSSIGVIQHINLVKLIGFCCKGDRRLLIYELMPNRSLDIHLFESNATFLNWSTRYRIAIGVARGLSYLHEGCRDCIIHCDIKPQNILLDTLFVPKIADFGMAKLVGRDFSRVLTTMRGTRGYLAPEWINGSTITPKVDVYSYGMMLFEIVSGRKNSSEEFSTAGEAHVVYFPLQAAKKLLEGDVRSVVDPKLCDDVNLEEVERVCKIACWCIQDEESDRPTMGEVGNILEGVSDISIPPLPRLLQVIFGKPHSAII